MVHEAWARVKSEFPHQPMRGAEVRARDHYCQLQTKILPKKYTIKQKKNDIQNSVINQ
jgi:hypothetical protein